jgi:hypothetical protein
MGVRKYFLDAAMQAATIISDENSRVNFEARN